MEPLHLLHRQEPPVVPRRRLRRGVEPEPGGVEHVLFDEDHRALDDVRELADVPGPRVALEHLLRVGRQAGRRPAHPAADAREDVPRQDEDVLGPFPERRDPERERRDPVVEVVAELLLADHRLEVEVRARDEPDVDVPVADVAEPAERLLLEGLQELRLDRRVHVADLVEEDDPAVPHLEEAGLRVHRAREGASLVAEELRLEELAREPRAVEVDESLFAPGAVRVDPPREDPLPRSGLAEDEDGAVPLEHEARPLVEPPHLRARPDERVEEAGLRPRDDLLPLAQALLLQEPLDEDEERLRLDRLRQELLGAVLDGADGEVDRAVRRQDDERRLLGELLDLRQDVERGAVREAVVGDDDVVRRRAEALHRLLAGVRLVDVEAVGPEEGGHPVPYGGVVLDEEDLRLRHGRLPPRGAAGAGPGGGRRRAPRPPGGSPPRRSRRAPRPPASRSRARARSPPSSA